MLMERELTINKFVCGRWFLSLIALLQMPVGMQAEDYNLWVGATQVTSDNSSDVLGDGKVSWNNGSKTLTLNNATIDMSNISGHYAVESSIDNLKVKLLGYNTITIADGSNNPNVFAYTGQGETAQLTFETEANEWGSMGSLNVEGINDVETLARVYTVTNQLQNSEDELETTGWFYEEKSGYYNVVRLKYVEYYDLWIGGAHISSDNLMPVSGGTAYIPATHTLHLDGYGYDDAIRSEMPELIVEVTGTYNSVSNFSYTGTGNGRIVFCAAEDSWSANTVNLNNYDGGGVIVGFDEVVIEEPLRVTTPAAVPTTWTADIHSAVISDDMFIQVGGIAVTMTNKDDVLGDGKVSYDAETSTLTLNNVNLNPDYAQNDGDLRVSIVTSLAQLNINLIGESQTYAIKTTNENSTLTFKSAEENRGAARLNFWYNADPYFIGFGEDKVTYNDGLCMREDSYNSSFPMIVALNVPKVITNEKERGLYFPDHVFTFALGEEIEGFDIYYANMLGGDPVKTTDGTFSLGTGRYVLNVYPIYPGMDTDPGRNWQYSSEIYAKVIEKPTFSVDASSVYNDDITVFLQNIPEQGTTSVWDDNLQENIEMPQVWYYIDDNKTDSVRYDATKGIPVTESCKVSAYILDEDSGRVVKSIPVEAEYTVISKTQLNISYAQNSREWASYCASERSLETPEGLQAYVVKQATKTGVQVEAIDYIPQGVGVLLKRTAEVAEPIVAKAYMEAEPEAPTNKLVGTTTSTSVRTLKGSVYVLYNDGFTRATSGAIGANRGYLLFDETVAAGARLSIFEDETTAVENVNRETLTNNQYYNLNGQRVVAPKKNGLYIVNGQKKIVK